MEPTHKTSFATETNRSGWEPEPKDEQLDEQIMEMFTKPMYLESEEIIGTVGGVSLCERSIGSLRPKTWLWGEPIQAYLNLYAQNSYHTLVLSPYLPYELGEKGVDEVLKSWRGTLSKITKEKTQILVPIQLGVHWTLCVLDRSKTLMTYYDGHLEEPEHMMILLSSLFVKAGIIPTNAKFLYEKDIPVQTNDFDCGIFIAQYGRCIIEGKPFNFHENDMEDIRRSMLYKILRKLKEPIQDPKSNSEERKTTCDKSNDNMPKNETIKTTAHVVEVSANDDEGIITADEGKGSDNGQGNEVTMEDFSETPLLSGPSEEKEPFVEVTEDGKEFTGNAYGDWKRMLKLSEVLKSFSDDPDVAWSILEKRIKENPEVALKWLKQVPPPRTNPGPMHFRFGKFSNFKKVKRIFERWNPSLTYENPHYTATHRARKKKPRKK